MLNESVAELQCREMRFEVSSSITLLCTYQNIICSEKKAVNHMRILKTNQGRSGRISRLQGKKWAFGQ